MAEIKRFDVKRLVIGAILAAVIVTIGLLLARIDRNQSTLQTVVGSSPLWHSSTLRVRNLAKDGMAV